MKFNKLIENITGQLTEGIKLKKGDKVSETVRSMTTWSSNTRTGTVIKISGKKATIDWTEVSGRNGDHLKGKGDIEIKYVTPKLNGGFNYNPPDVDIEIEEKMKFEKLAQLIITEKKRQTIAFIPGSFKPPTKAHLGMIQEYAKKADKVYVIISKPSAKAERKTKMNTVISPEITKDIFEIYKKKYNLKNVEFVIAKERTPVLDVPTLALKYNDADIMLGTSTKDEDGPKGGLKRWVGTKEYIEKNNDTLNVLDPKETSVEPLGGVSASFIRDHIDDEKHIRQYFPDKLSDKEYDLIISKLSGEK